MKILVLYSSPRKTGNSTRLGKAVVEAIREKHDVVETMELSSLTFTGCIDCKRCEKTGQCILNDEFTPFYKALDESDLVIFCTPIYFNGVSWIGKMAIDRLQSLWAKHRLGIKEEKVRRGISVLAGGEAFHPKQFQGAIGELDYFYRAAGVKKYCTLSFSNSDEQTLRLTPGSKRELRVLNEAAHRTHYRIEGDHIVKQND